MTDPAILAISDYALEQAVPPSLQSFLAKDGILDRRVGEIRGKLNDPVALDRLFDEVRALRRAAGLADDGANRPEAGAIRTDSNTFACRDAVLRLVIHLQHGDQDVDQRLVNEAANRYLTNVHFYRQVLIPLMPYYLREHFLRLAYANGLNLNAADDLSVFLHDLSIKRQQARSRNKLGVASGITMLDEALCGFRGLTLVSGAKGAGKTTLCLQAIDEALSSSDDTAVLAYSLDMPKESIYTRLLCRHMKVAYRKLLGIDGGTEIDLHDHKDLKAQWQRLRVVERNFDRTTVLADDGNSERSAVRGLSAEDLIRDCTQLLNRTGAGRIVVFIDMLQKWVVPGSAPRQDEPDAFRLDAIDQLRRWSRNYLAPDGLAILATVELRKDADDLSIDDMKGDGRFGSDADQVLLLSPLEKTHCISDDPVKLKIRIAKARDGGRMGDVPVVFDHVHGRLLDAPSSSKTGAAAKGRPTHLDPIGS